MRATSFGGAPLLSKICQAISLSTESKALVRSSMHMCRVWPLSQAPLHRRRKLNRASTLTLCMFYVLPVSQLAFIRYPIAKILHHCRAGRSSTAGRLGSSGRSSNNNNRWSSNGVPLCPRHGLECLSLTANTSNNPGRRFFKCSHQTEADSCLKFAWADEYDGAPAGWLCMCYYVTLDLPALPSV